MAHEPLKILFLLIKYNKFPHLTKCIVKKLLPFLLLFFICTTKAQTNSKPKSSNKSNSTSTVSQLKTISNNQAQNLVNTMQHDTCLHRKFSIVFYVLLDSLYLPGQASNQNIAMFMDTLNSRFSRICVQFENCSTVYIPNHSYAEWYRPTTDSIVTSQWYTHRTINIYLVDSIYQNFPFEPEGYTYPPPTNSNAVTKDVIVLEKWHLLTLNGLIAFHQIGHYFGLVHTHDEINPTLPASPPPPLGVASMEYVDRSNCLIHGDGICDTEADPMNGIFKDGKGDFYLKPVDNFMSFSSTACRYTQQQYNRMAYVMITARKYLH